MFFCLFFVTSCWCNCNWAEFTKSLTFLNKSEGSFSESSLVQSLLFCLRQSIVTLTWQTRSLSNFLSAFLKMLLAQWLVTVLVKQTLCGKTPSWRHCKSNTFNTDDVVILSSRPGRELCTKGHKRSYMEEGGKALSQPVSQPEGRATV